MFNYKSFKGKMNEAISICRQIAGWRIGIAIDYYKELEYFDLFESSIKDTNLSKINVKKDIRNIKVESDNLIIEFKNSSKIEIFYLNNIDKPTNYYNILYYSSNYKYLWQTELQNKCANLVSI